MLGQEKQHQWQQWQQLKLKSDSNLWTDAGQDGQKVIDYDRDGDGADDKRKTDKEDEKEKKAKVAFHLKRKENVYFISRDFFAGKQTIWTNKG